jgi:hypothetical protein
MMDKYLRSDSHLRSDSRVSRAFRKDFCSSRAVFLASRATGAAWRLWVVALLGSGFLTGLMPSAWAEPLIPDNLIAQDVVEGLPPPPLVPGVPAQPDSPNPDQSVLSPRYVVLVNGDSSRLLNQVQRVASNASVQEYQGQRVIQVATFDDSDRAERQVQLLASRGIGAKILSVANAELPDSDQSASSQSVLLQPDVQAQSPQFSASPDLPPPNLLPSQSVPREVNFGGTQQPTLDQFPSPPALPANSPAALRESNTSPDSRDSSRAARSSQSARVESSSSSFTGGRAYFVVIPGKQGELDAITNQVIRLGDGF